MSSRGRWVQAQWRNVQRTLWDRELQQFGPIPRKRHELDQAQERTLWQTEAWARIMTEADRSRRQAATQARRHGATYHQIGQALGISRQAARKLISPPHRAG